MSDVDVYAMHGQPWARPPVEILEHAGLAPQQVDRPLGRLFLLLCERYDLDPALKQLEVINSKQGPQVYITADGYRHIALASGELDGITIPDTSTGEHGWRAHVQVWRKGCAHPFDGRAGAGYVEKNDDPEALAITRATRRALRNAFDPIRVEAEYAAWMRDTDVENDPDPRPAVGGVSDRGAPPPPVAPGDDAGTGLSASSPPLTRSQHADQRLARERFNMLGEKQRTAFRRKHAIEDMGAPWPGSALDELIDGVG